MADDQYSPEDIQEDIQEQEVDMVSEGGAVEELSLIHI